MTALILEPLAGHPKELREFIENHLEAPFDGTPEARKAATEGVFETFPGFKDQAQKIVRRAEERARAAAAASGADETPDAYPATVERSKRARGDT